jgi:long-chain acyl-CoA synthetase
MGSLNVDLESLSLEDAVLLGMTPAIYARQYPDRTAIYASAGNRSFLQLNDHCNQLVRFLRRLGLTEGDSVALLCSNRPEFVEVVLAVQRCGMRVTPINWHLTGEEVGYIVDNCEAKAFIADARFSKTASAALASAPNLIGRLAIDGDIAGFDAYESCLTGLEKSDIPDPVMGSAMLYTSGTTGRPKGVYRKHPVPVLLMRGDVPYAYEPEEEKHLCTGPAYHAAPFSIDIVRPLIAGVPVVFMDKWDPEETLRLIDQHAITRCHMVATMFHRLLQLPDHVKAKYDTSSLRVVTHGAAPCPVHVKRAMIDWLGPVLLEYYAATEGGGGFLIGSDEWLLKPGSVGKPGPDFDNKILDDNGNEVPRGETGTIYMKAPETGRFQYFKDDEKTDASYRGDYFTLGDMGYFDDDGYLFLTGRTAELIISGGVNIYPQEIDSQIMQHEAVLDICTIGVPNEEWGEEIKSVIQLNPGYEASPGLTGELLDFAKARLPGFKCPRSIEFVDDLPRLPTGKIQRRIVREPYWAGREKSI